MLGNAESSSEEEKHQFLVVFPGGSYQKTGNWVLVVALGGEPLSVALDYSGF